MTTAFARLGVPTTLVSVLDAARITVPTPIQDATLPDSLAGRDVLGRGRTGSGKTYAFSLPVVARLAADMTGPDGRVRHARPGRPRALVLAPTRELATQIAETLTPLADAAGLRVHTIFGGVGQNPQVEALRRGVDILVACPGRLLDLMGQGHVTLSDAGITVLDEADHMADMGFLPMVRKILDTTPARAQRLLFSATLDAGIDVLVRRYLHDPVVHEADSPTTTPVESEHRVLHVRGEERLDVVADLAAAPGRTIVFTRTKHGAKKLAKQLSGKGIGAVELHGNLSQNARTRNLDAFHSGQAPTLVATDIAARGIHVDDVALVVHADPPAEHKAYLHRSGRTARAGATGTVVTIMTDDQVGDVRTLLRAAGISAKPERVRLGDSALLAIAPGERVYGAVQVATPAQQQLSRAGSGGGSGSGRSTGAGSGSGRGSASGSGHGSGSGQRRSRRGGRGRGAGSGAGAPGSAGRGGGGHAGGAKDRADRPVRYSSSTPATQGARDSAAPASGARRGPRHATSVGTASG